VLIAVLDVGPQILGQKTLASTKIDSHTVGPNHHSSNQATERGMQRR